MRKKIFKSTLWVSLLTFVCTMLIIMGVFALCFFTTGYVSLGSVMGALAFALSFSVFYWGNPFVMIGGIFIGLLAVVMHHANIGRLIRGTERKVHLFEVQIL